MYYMKGWMRCLKQFEPVVLNLSGQDYIFKKAAIIAEDTSFLNNMIYIGKLSEAVYRILSVSGITMLLINDLNINLDKLKCGDNTVIVLPSNTNRDELYSACNRFLDIQDEIIENRHRLLDAYIADNSLPAILNHTSRIIKNPVMVLDNSFRLKEKARTLYGLRVYATDIALLNTSHSSINSARSRRSEKEIHL